MESEGASSSRTLPSSIRSDSDEFDDSDPEDNDDFETLAVIDSSRKPKQGLSDLPEDVLQRQSALFLGDLKEFCNTTQKAVDGVVQGVDELIQLYNNYLKAQIFKLSEGEMVKKSDIEKFFEHMKHQSIFEGVQNKYRLDVYEARHYEGHSKPIIIVLKWKTTILHGKVKAIPDEFGYCADFLKDLEALLQSDDVLRCIDNPRKFENSTYRCALDGKYYRNHPVVKKYPDALAFILYVDDITPTEVLSSYQQQGLRNYSWSLANIYPELRSSLKAINILALVKAKVAKKYRNEPFLRIFIASMNRLSSDEGVKFIIKGKERIFHGFLLFIIGDYPACGNLAGFKESASKAIRPCRQCMVHQLELRFKFTESEVIMRSEAMHAEHIRDLKAQNFIPSDDTPQAEDEQEHTGEEEEQSEAGNEVTLNENLSAKYGVNYESCLLKLDHFQITSCLPQDTMHLFMEGILELECRLLLEHSIGEKKINLKNVNSFLENHHYGDLKTDKPSPIEAKHVKTGLHQNSSQMLMLSSLLPFILKGKCDSARLTNFILLLMILGICMAWQVTEEDVGVLNMLIVQYLKTFNELYPNRMLPKHHFLIHLATQILLFGPLTEQWAMRWEAFHARMKRLTKILHSSKNLAFSLISRLMRRRALEYRKYGDNFLTGDIFEAIETTKTPLSLLPFKECLISVLTSWQENDLVSVINTLKWYGSEFRTGESIICVDEDESEHPVFGAVLYIYQYSDNFIIVYRQLLVMGFCSDLNAYEVKFSDKGCFAALNLSNSSDVTPLMHIKFNSSDFIVLRRKRNPPCRRLIADI